MNLCIVTVMHGRHDLTRLWAAHLPHGIPVFAAITENDVTLEGVCRGSNIRYIAHENQPLGKKHNAALELALSDPIWEAAMFLPSDDFIPSRWVADVTAAFEAGHKYVMPPSCGLYDLPTGKGMILSDKAVGSRRYGAGRAIHREALEEVFPLWSDHRRQGLDSDSHGRLIAHGFDVHFPKIDYLPVTDIKTPENIHRFSQWKTGRKATAEEVLWMLTDETRAAITNRSLSGSGG